VDRVDDVPISLAVARWRTARELVNGKGLRHVELVRSLSARSTSARGSVWASLGGPGSLCVGETRISIKMSITVRRCRKGLDDADA
jgi:hypothetical protein